MKGFDAPGDDKVLWRDRLSVDLESGKASPCQRHPRRQILPSSLEGGAAEAFPRPHRRARKEPEIPHRRRRRTQILEALYEGLRGMLERDEHGRFPLVSRARRRQRECAIDRVPNCLGYPDELKMSYPHMTEVRRNSCWLSVRAGKIERFDAVVDRVLWRLI